MKLLYSLCLAGISLHAAGNVELTSAEKKLLEMTPAEYREAVIPPEVPRLSESIMTAARYVEMPSGNMAATPGSLT